MNQIERLIVAFATTAWVSLPAQAQIPRFGAGIPDPAVLASDEATGREFERIEKLAPSKSAALNQESLNEAKVAVQSFRAFPENLVEFEKLSVDEAKRKIESALTQMSKAGAACSKPVFENHLVIKRQFDQLSGNMPFRFVYRSGGEPALSEAEEATIREVDDFLELPREEVCKRVQDPTTFSALKSQVEQGVDILSRRHSANLKSLRSQAPRAKRLAEAWEKYRDALLKSIEEQSAPASKVADQLAWIIAVFCGFGVLMFLALKVFTTDVQLELVASGQVIQFATVMVLLIVICVLGMSTLLKENTLGTLLGGIGGYVLSQGVGRAASRATRREIQAESGTD